MSQNWCSCSHHKVVPLAAVLFGLLFLLGNVGIFTDGFVNFAWPILVIIAGGTKLFGHKCHCCRVAAAKQGQ